MKKTNHIILNSTPILIMIALIPIVRNDYLLAGIYILIILFALKVKRNPKDFLTLAFGFSVMIIFELFFVSTGVETFTRNTLLGLMPLWLPFLWAYGFVAIKRGIEILDNN